MDEVRDDELVDGVEGQVDTYTVSQDFKCELDVPVDKLHQHKDRLYVDKEDERIESMMTRLHQRGWVVPFKVDRRSGGAAVNSWQWAGEFLAVDGVSQRRVAIVGSPWRSSAGIHCRSVRVECVLSFAVTAAFASWWLDMATLAQSQDCTSAVASVCPGSGAGASASGVPRRTRRWRRRAG